MTVQKNLVWEQSTSTGTGNKTLSRFGGFARVSESFGTGDNGASNPVLFFANKDAAAAEWEVVQGYMSDATTFVPVTVLDSSNGGSAVNFSAGTKFVTHDITAANQAYNSGSTVTDGHVAVFDGTTGRALKSAGVLPFNQNVLVNGDGYINQRAATTAADDTYHVDRWYALTQSADIGISQLSNVADGTPSAIRLTQSNATAQRIGSAQIVEGIISRAARGKSVTLSGKVRMSAAATVRYAILAWTGTADSATSDVVNNWTSGTYTTGNFFISTTTSLVAEGNLALSANTLTDFSLTGSVPSGCNNLIVLIWSSATMAQNATLDFRAKLEEGVTATSFVPRHPDTELSICRRYFQRLSPSSNAAIIGYRVSTQYITGYGLALIQPLRGSVSLTHSSPTFTNAAPGSSNSLAFRVPSGSFLTITGALTLSFSGGGAPHQYSITLTAGTSFSGTAGDIGALWFGSGVYIDFESEL